MKQPKTLSEAFGVKPDAFMKFILEENDKIELENAMEEARIRAELNHKKHELLATTNEGRS